jgi:hypothetical protein
MKIKRSDGVSRARIVSHNKKVLYWIIFLIILLIGVIIASRILDEGVEENNDFRKEFVCKTDTDCVVIETTCCDCESGGQEACISKELTKNYTLSGCDSDQLCATVFNCNQNPCKCIKGKCSF